MGGCGCVPARLWLQKQDRLGLAWGQRLAIPDVDSGELWSVWEQRSSLLGEDGFSSLGGRAGPGAGKPGVPLAHVSSGLLRIQQFC